MCRKIGTKSCCIRTRRQEKIVETAIYHGAAKAAVCIQAALVEEASAAALEAMVHVTIVNIRGRNSE